MSIAIERTSDSGTFERKEFKLAATSEAFAILSSGLYSNKITAVIRELSTNAVDSHIEAGTNQPFDVHLPSSSEPWFSIRDYGTGLSHDKVMELYSTYFGTDKKLDLRTTGSLGLGSKSPLSKSRSFTVTSWHGGQERHYIIVLNEDRIPEVNYLPEQTRRSDQPNGVCVQLAVEPRDITEYGTEAQAVYRYFGDEHQPNITHGRYHKFALPEVVISGEGWRIFKRRGGDVPMAVHGNIGYPIDPTRLSAFIDNQQHQLLQCALEIDFPNGSLDYVPSREHLSYTRATREALTRRLSEIADDLERQLNARIGECTTLWSARCLAHQLFWNYGGLMRDIYEVVRNIDLQWQGQTLTQRDVVFRKEWGAEGFYRAHGRGGKRVIRKTTDVMAIQPRQTLLLVEDDLPRGTQARCRRYLEEHQECSSVYIMRFANAEIRREVYDALGLDGTEFVKASELSPPERRGGGGDGKRTYTPTPQAYRYRKGWRYTQDSYWTLTEIDIDNPECGVYVEMFMSKVRNNTPQSPCHPREVQRLLDDLKKLGIQTPEVIIGARQQLAKKLAKTKGWVDFWVWAKREVTKATKKKRLLKDHANRLAYYNISDSHWEALVDHIDHFPAHSPLFSFLKAAKKCSQLEDKGVLDLCSRMGVTMPDVKPEYDFTELTNQLSTLYPMLDVMLKTIEGGYTPRMSTSTLNIISIYVKERTNV